jgi:hypothetical protein
VKEGVSEMVAHAAEPPAALGRLDKNQGAEIGEGPGSDQPLWAGPESVDAEVVALGDEPDLAARAETGNELEENEGEAVESTESEAEEAWVTVPSFVGMSLGEAIRTARQAGVEIAPEGSGVAVAQSPASGLLPRGAQCRVSFRPGG